MKKLFVPLAAAAVLAVVRAVTALSLAEPQTGFFPAGTAGFYTAALLLLTADSFFAARLLRRSHNIDLLGLKNLWQELHRA